ncbi:hypothetical protein [Acidisoma silvae]|uniref:Toxin-activating lysine-acyltransferase n=1 Tax=Acidisoma silvae TaxID=2802396 RepID=A0A963YVX2_9PROT|nr:hypothetical protein [Acidisoma silvae]MCB8878098.1 hypothetical protein [Acidisoma silvae]
MMSAPMPGLHLVSFKDPAAALGIAVRLTMRYPVFAEMPFGTWADILEAQVNRGHQAFVVDEAMEVRGFVGYGLTSRDNAEAWANGTRTLTSAECLAGDCLIINVWISDNSHTRNFLIRAIRRLGLNKQALYFKRLYADRTVRPSCIRNNVTVARHVARDSGEAGGTPRVDEAETIS